MGLQVTKKQKMAKDLTLNIYLMDKKTEYAIVRGLFGVFVAI
jgi:hypothetical protein